MQLLLKILQGLSLGFALSTALLEGALNSITEQSSLPDAEHTPPQPPKIGIFSLPPSQQPSPLFGFGGNIIDADEVQIFMFADDFIGRQKTTKDLFPNIVFGVTEYLSVLFGFPFSTELKDNNLHSSGWEDCMLQLEYAIYNKSTETYVDQVTVVGNITFPSGSATKNPPTGFGAPSLFLGATYYHTLIDWFMFAAPGAILTSSNHGTKFGNQFLYQCGLGRTLPSPCGWIYAWMVEVDGQYNQRNRINGTTDRNSGGNTIYATPSLWISSKNILFQFGLSLPINQNVFGHQRKFEYAWNVNFAWSFY